jgi:hypothetical protein
MADRATITIIIAIRQVGQTKILLFFSSIDASTMLSINPELVEWIDF